MVNDDFTKQTAYDCGHNFGIIQERDRIHEQIVKLREEALENCSNTFTTVRGDKFKKEAYQKVLDLIDTK